MYNECDVYVMRSMRTKASAGAYGRRSFDRGEYVVTTLPYFVG